MAQKPIESEEQDQGRLGNYDLPASGPVKRTDFTDDIEVVNEMDFASMAELEAFMHEELLVEVAMSPERHAEMVIPVNVQGTVQNFIRGKQQWVKRKYVENLARCKIRHVATQEYINPVGERATRITRQYALLYPFRVIQDKNPLGYPWLQKILAEPG